MPLHESSPGEGRRSKAVHFPHCATAGGESWQAYVAGRCHWFECHKEGKTKPCLACVSNGDLTCSHDHNIDEPFERGYFPLIRKSDYKPCFVIVYPYLRDHVDALKWKHLVTVTRGKGATDTVTLIPALGKFPPFTSTLACFQKPADLTESLLRIWKIPALTEWYRRTHTLSDNPVSQPQKNGTGKPRVRSDGHPFSPEMQAAAARYNAPEADELAVEEYEQAREKLRKKSNNLKPETNGKH